MDTGVMTEGTMVEQEFLIRDVFGPAAVHRLAENISAAWPDFDQAGFTAAVIPNLAALGLVARSDLIRDTLREYLPQDFTQAVKILLDALGPEISQCELSGLDGFIVMSLSDFVAKYGLEHYEVSMQALYQMTKHFTAERAIRAFLQQYPEQTLAVLAGWAADPNCHVRRLVSEGTRPRLPWAVRLKDFVRDPRPVLRLLDLLKDDPERMVQRSVANNLNDIAKDHPELVVATLSAWQAYDSPNMRWIMQHASRTLIKQGQPGALALLGFSTDVKVAVTDLQVRTPVVRLGEQLQFDFTIRSEADEPQELVIDFIIHHVKASGKRTPKVFKLAQKRLETGQEITITKKHSMRQISTRVYYPGIHLLEIQVNGQVRAQAAFELNV